MKAGNLKWALCALISLVLFTLGQLAQAQASEATVELARVTEGFSSSVVRLPGTVLSRRDAEISAEVEGSLKWVAEVGEQIERGEPVALIDDHLLQLQLRNDNAEISRINADIDYNRRQVKRLQKLAKQNNTAQSELDQLNSRVEMLGQDLKIAEVSRDRTLYDIDRASVLAPFSGVVVSRSMTTGEYTQIASVLLRLVDTSALEISVAAPLRVARYNQAGSTVQVESNGIQVMAPIRGVVPVGDTRSRMMELRLDLEPGGWFIGEAVTVELPDGASQHSLQVPRDALVLRNEQVYVYGVSGDNTAIKIPVTAGAGRGTQIAVRGNLSAGDRVVVRGAERLRDGQAVKIISSDIASSI
jgi:RND family efflux transporter MFP subunit